VVECLIGPLRGPESPAIITYQLRADIKKLGKLILLICFKIVKTNIVLCS
jgi:hypothetical protein